MDTQLLLLIGTLLVAGSLAGFFSGLLGIGGGAVTVPVLYYTFQSQGFPPQTAMYMSVATSASVITVTAARSAWWHHKRGAVDTNLIWPRPRISGVFSAWGIWIGLGAFFGSSLLSRKISGEVLTGVFGVVSIFLALQFIFGRPHWKIANAVPKGALSSSTIGLTLGALCGLLGIGFGAIGVTLLMLCGQPVHRAIGTASAIGIFIGVFATAGYIISGWGVPERAILSIGYVNLLGFVVLSSTGFLFAPIGVKTAHRLEQNRLRMVFGICLLTVAVKMISDVI